MKERVNKREDWWTVIDKKDVKKLIKNSERNWQRTQKETDFEHRRIQREQKNRKSVRYRVYNDRKFLNTKYEYETI